MKRQAILVVIRSLEIYWFAPWILSVSPDRVLNAGVIYSYQMIVLQGQLTNNIPEWSLQIAYFANLCQCAILYTNGKMSDPKR